MNRMTVDEMIEDCPQIFGDIPNSERILLSAVPERPTCYECGAPGKFVVVRKLWVDAGCPSPPNADNLPGEFFCPDHAPDRRYGFWLTKPAAGRMSTIQDFHLLLHFAGKKPWGIGLISWLLSEVNLYGVDS